MRAAALGLCLLASPAVAFESAPRFFEEAEAAGLTHVYGGPWEYFVGGGVAVFDCSGDRKPDLFIAGGAGPARLFVNQSRASGLSFQERAIGIDDSSLTKVTGAYPLDIDNDGTTDLAVLRVGRNLLLRGLGACRFEVANRAWGFDGGRAWTTAFSAEWEAGAAFPTLAFGNYVDRSAPGSPWGTCHDNVLARPTPDADQPDYSEPAILSPGYCALSVLFTDWNRSGEAALRITNDRHYYRGGEEQMWRVTPGRPPRLYSRSDGWRSVKIWGMGIAAHDLNADGYPDYALTSMGDTKLQTLDPESEDDRPVYRDIALENRATAHRPYTGGDIRPSTGWHAEFGDVNNDLLTDLFIAKGNVEAMPDFADFDPDNLLIGSFAGGFDEKGDVSGIALNRKGRGGALADLDLDGDLDLVVVNRGAPVSLFRNTGWRRDGRPVPMGNWLQVALRQSEANRDAVGAKLSIRVGTRTLVRDVTVGGGHASGQMSWTHVGLGTAERAEIRVRWPNGDWSHGYRVFANQFVQIDRGAVDVRYWMPRPDPENRAGLDAAVTDRTSASAD